MGFGTQVVGFPTERRRLHLMLPPDPLLLESLLQLRLPHLPFALQLIACVLRRRFCLAQPGLQFFCRSTLLPKTVLECSRPLIDRFEFIFQPARLGIDLSCFASYIRLALSYFVAVLFKRCDTRCQARLNSLPVLRSKRILCL